MQNYNILNSGITAPKGFKASGIHCGIRKNKNKKDLALITADVLCNCASVYTLNLVKGAPILVTKQNLQNGKAQALICNSGNANTCNANGIEIAEGMCELVEKHLGISKNDVVVASTGVIGQELDLSPMANGMEELVANLGEGNSVDANDAIMTTDTIHKSISIEFEIDGKKCVMGGIAKGSGMIHPNMATMLVFLTTDVAISSAMLQKAISNDVKDTFNMVSVDGDTSTNDMLTIFASGLAGNAEIVTEGKEYNEFCLALNYVTKYLCKLIAKDGEGATKLLECNVVGAKDTDNAKIIAKSVICSSLVKAAMFGADANCGRILCAVGYSKAEVDVSKVNVSYKSSKGEIEVCNAGNGLAFDEKKAKEILLENEITINVTCNDGNGKATAWGCDLTYDYVKINGDYRT